MFGYWFIYMIFLVIGNFGWKGGNFYLIGFYVCVFKVGIM